MVKEKGRREWASLISSAEGGTLPILENKVIKLYYWGMFHFLNKITVCVLSRFSCVWLFATLWKVAHQTPLSMEFSRQEHWSGLPCPHQGGFPNPGIELCFLRLLHCRWILYCWATREAKKKKPTRNDSNIREKEMQPSVQFSSVQFSSVTQSCPSPCEPMVCSTPSLPVHHHLSEFTQTHVHWVSDATPPSHPLSSPSPPAFTLSQHQDLFKWVSSPHQVAKVLEFQLQHQSFQWTPRTDLL